MAWRHLELNCGPLSISIVDGIMRFYMEWSTNINATAVTVFQAVGIILVSFEYRFVTTFTNRFPDLASGNVASMPWPRTAMVQKV